MSLPSAKDAAIAAWVCDDTSDDVGSYTLTDNATVGVGTGKVTANCGDFELDNAEYYSVAQDANLGMSGNVDFTLRVWVKLESKPDVMGLMSIWGGGAQRAYQLIYDSGQDRYRFTVRGATGVLTSVDANNFGSPNTGEWHLVHGWHDAVNDVIGIAVNAGLEDTSSHSDGIDTTTTDFMLGHREQNNKYLDGLLNDAVVMRDYLMTSDDRDDDYDGGNGVAFSNWDSVGSVLLLDKQLTRGVLRGVNRGIIR